MIPKRGGVDSTGLVAGADFTALSDRLSLLLVVRLFMATVVLFSSYSLPQLTLHESAIVAAQGYVGISLFVELMYRLLTRHTNRRLLAIVNIMLLIDGLFVAIVLGATGQSRSAFIFLAYAHIVSVTLLVGFRTGLKMAFWHSALLLTVYYLGMAGLLPQLGLSGQSTDARLTKELEIAQASALWLVAIVTAAFSSLNERELRRRKGELTIIADLTSIIETTRRPSEVMQALVDAATHKLDADRAVVICNNAGTMTVVVSDESVVAAPKHETLPAISEVIAQAVATSAPVLVRRLDPEADAYLVGLLPDAENVAIVPLIAEGETVAVLITDWGVANRRRVRKPVIDLLSNVAGRVALSLSNTMLLAEVQRLASVDGLTGLPNRRTFNQALEREIARSLRSGQPVSLLMLDIDHFKLVNDTYGHQMGDEVLAESASGVMAACRAEDLPARYGGEEIVVIMPNCSADQALAAGERIRQALADGNIALKTVTASGGVATIPNNATDMVGLLAAADEALYLSKDRGRDCTTLSTRVGARIDLPVRTP